MFRHGGSIATHITPTPISVLLLRRLCGVSDTQGDGDKLGVLLVKRHGARGWWVYTISLEANQPEKKQATCWGEWGWVPKEWPVV